MRILHVTPTFFPAVGGIETVVRSLVQHLRSHGIIADVLHISPSNKESRKDRVDDGTVWRVPLFPNRLIGITPSIRPLLMSYDLLHVHDPQGMALTANILVQGRGKRKLLSTHGGYFHTTKFSLMKQLHWRLLASKVLNAYDAVLGSSAGDCEKFRGKIPRIKLVTNGIEVSKFTCVDHNPVRSATRWIYWGRLSRNKRIDLLVDTVKRSRDAGLAVDLTIAGQDFDGLLPSIQAQVARCDLTEHIRILGPLSDADLLAECADHTVFITASEYEGFGLSIFEAMAAGLVVICRDTAPMNSFVVHGKNGLLVRFDGSASDLDSIKSLCATPTAEMSAMREFARSSAIPYSWDTVVERYIDAYDHLMSMSRMIA